jgi:hypothetical protein
MFEETTDEHLDEIEAFFIERDAPVFHEVSPLECQLIDDRRYYSTERRSCSFSIDACVRCDRIDGIRAKSCFNLIACKWSAIAR